MKKYALVIPSLLLATHLLAIDTVRVNSAFTYQTIKGWGGTGGENTQYEGTPPYLMAQLINESVSGLGLTGLRYESYQGNYSQSYGQHHTWEWTNDNGSPDTLNSSVLDTGAVDYYMENLFVPWKNQTVANGDSFTFYMSPSWYYDGSTGDIPAFLRYSPGEYAEYYISNLKHLRDRYGLIPDYVTMCNEAGNNNQFTWQVVATMIKTVMPWIQASGFPNTFLQFPECVSPQVSWQYIQNSESDPAVWPYIKSLSYHLYGTNDPYRAEIDSMALALGITTGQTEQIGQGISELYADLTTGGVSYWDFYGNSDYCPENANNTWYTHAAKFWTCRQVMHYNRPGCVRISSVSNDTPKVTALAFEKGGQITTVILNNNAASTATTVTVTGLPAGNYGVSQVLSSGSPYTELGVFTVSGTGVLTVPVSNQGIVAIYPHAANLPPVAINWAASPTYLDLPASAVNLTSSAVDPELSTVSYHWTVDSFPAGATPVFSNPNIASPSVTGMTVAGNYAFTVRMSDGTDSTKKTVTVPVFPGNQAPVIAALQSRIPVIITLPVDTCIVKGSAYDIEADALIYNYSIISQPAGAAATLVTPAATNTVVENMAIPGDYTVRLSVSDPTHTTTRDIKLTVYPLNDTPVISSVSAAPGIITLPADSTQLSAITSDPNGDIITHWWTVKSAPAGASPSFSLQGERITEARNLTVPGTYVFMLTLVDRTLYTTKLDTVAVHPAATSICAGSTTTITETITGGSWASTNTTVATVGSGTGIVTGVSAGTATISYAVSGVFINATILTVNPIPLAIAVSAPVCMGSTVTLSDVTTSGTWSSSNTTVATVGSGSGVVASVLPGTTTISYTLGTGCGVVDIVTVNPLPVAGSITGSSGICAGFSATLSDAAGSGAWSSTNTGIATVTGSGAVTGISSGTTTISYTVTNICGTVAATTIVTVNPLPATPSSITGTATVCAGLITTLSDATAGGAWSSSNTLIATAGSTGIITGVSPGTATISYIIANSCSSVAATVIVTVDPLPATPSSITGTATVCAGSTTTLSDATAGGAWSSSNTLVATTGTTGIVTGVSPGTATISYTVTNSCGSAAATVIVTVDPLPATPSSITGTATVCAGSTTTLSDVTAGGTWSSSNTLIATAGSTGIITGVSPGTATISYTVTNSCGSAAATVIVTVDPIPATPSSITGATTVCAGLITTLSDATAGGAWSSSNTLIATTGSTGIITGVSPGTATISYTVTNSCGSAAATVIVTVNTIPATPSSISGTATVCTGLTTALSDATTGGAWSSSNTLIATTGSTGIITGVSSAAVVISYTITNICGSAAATTVVTVNSLPSAITGITTVCIGSAITLVDVTAGGTWSSSSTAIATVDAGTGIAAGLSAGAATISYTTGGSCTATYNITVNPGPVSGTITGTDSACAGDTAILSDLSGGGLWASSNTSVAVVTASGSFIGVSAGAATISYTVTNTCGTANAVLIIHILPAGTCSSLGIYKAPVAAITELKADPNPNTGAFSIMLSSNNAEQVNVIITNAVGEKVKELTTTTNKEEDIRIEKAGIYLISASTVHGKYVAKVVVE